MSEPWKATFSISEELAQKLIEAQFPSLQPVYLEFLGSGWDNLAFLVNNQYVFRFPKREEGISYLANELKLLGFLQNRLPLSIPSVQFIGQPMFGYPSRFSGYPKLSGVTACTKTLSDEARIKNAISLAQFLSSLHAISVEEVKNMGATHDLHNRIDPKTRIPLILNKIDELQKLNLLDMRLIANYIIGLKDIQKSYHICLVHGDLYARHLLVDSDENITGVIDWGDVELSNPAIDLAIVHSFLPPQVHTVFREAYGFIDDTIWEIARIRAIFSSLTITLYGHKINDEALKKEGLWGLANIISGLSRNTQRI